MTLAPHASTCTTDNDSLSMTRDQEPGQQEALRFQGRVWDHVGGTEKTASRYQDQLDHARCQRNRATACSVPCHGCRPSPRAKSSQDKLRCGSWPQAHSDPPSGLPETKGTAGLWLCSPNRHWSPTDSVWLHLRLWMRRCNPKGAASKLLKV